MSVLFMLLNNRLLLDITVIDLMSIVHVDKSSSWVEIAKNLEMRTSGGGVVSNFGHPRTRGVQKGQIFADVLYGWPPTIVTR